MEQYVQEILDVLWEVEGWNKDETRNRVRVRKIVKEFSPEQVDLVRLARKYDAWIETKQIVPTPSNFYAFVCTLVRKGDVQPYSLTTTGAALSVEEQLRLKAVKRKRELAALGFKDDDD